jgi:alpha-tubulin suppressor-like RCC1 family protein
VGLGRNYYGRLGLNDEINRSSPTQVGSLTDWKVISAGGYHSLAIKTDGTLWAWGVNWGWTLGLNDTIYRSSPTQIGASTDWKKKSPSDFSG